MLTSINLSCEGSNIRTITYSAEDCWFLDSENVKAWNEQWIIKEDGQKNSPYQTITSYTVDYTQQDDKNLRVQLPIYRLEDANNANYALIFSRVETLPSGVAHGANYEAPTYTQQYAVMDAYVTVTVKFEDGTEQQKLLRLQPQAEDESRFFSIRIEVVE